mmetsp:Transcript_56096/g.149666  ORF Transcript_56096/g.149666 Transcript_56096/m.149666 type:complete len:238 (+) Transcript_56096:2387-3100(+)
MKAFILGEASMPCKLAKTFLIWTAEKPEKCGACAPQIHCWSLHLPRRHLWARVRRRASWCCWRLVHTGTTTEATDLHDIVCCDKQVFRVYVPVEDTHGMEVGKAHQKLRRPTKNFSFRRLTCWHRVHEALQTALTALKANVDCFVIFQHSSKLYDMAALSFLAAAHQRFHLFHDVVLPLLLSQSFAVQHLHCEGISRGPLDHLVDGGEGIRVERTSGRRGKILRQGVRQVKLGVNQK